MTLIEMPATMKANIIMNIAIAVRVAVVARSNSRTHS